MLWSGTPSRKKKVQAIIFSEMPDNLLTVQPGKIKKQVALFHYTALLYLNRKCRPHGLMCLSSCPQVVGLFDKAYATFEI